MTNKSCLTRAYRQHWLWPQIHSAVDVFIKRRAAEADGYELTWRLIHIWECVVVALAQASTARLLTMPDHEADIRAIREKAYGRTWNGTDETMNVRVGALDGSIDKWIEILEYVSTIENVQSKYLEAVARFLNSQVKSTNEFNEDSDLIETKPINFQPLYLAWSRACDVTQGTPEGETNVKRALKAVNSFRNRFAHVPFPYDPIQRIYRALEQCTEEMFSAPSAADNTRGSLSGAIAFRQSMIRGSNTLENTVTETNCAPTFVYELDGNSQPELWPAKSFVHFDGMMHPYVLTRLKDEAGLWEYTRYLAEVSAVITRSDDSFFLDFPIPDEAEYAEPAVEEGGDSSLESEKGHSSTSPNDTEEKVGRPVYDMGEANFAIRRRDFQPAIEYLESRVAANSHYHVGWLKLGQAKRELAVDLWHESEESSPDSLEHVRELLIDSIAAFKRASQHVERKYQAEALYNKSKSHYRLAQIDSDPEQLYEAIDNAEYASESYPEAKHESWIEYLLNVHIVPDKT